MAALLRGDVVWADLDPVQGQEQSGLRPVLVLSDEFFNTRSGTVIAVALTSQAPRAGFPLSYEISSDKLPKKSWVKISQIRTLSTSRLGKKLARLDETEVDRVVVDSLYDPLVHMLRNSLDHGIESREERARTSKPVDTPVNSRAISKSKLMNASPDARHRP